MICKFCNSNTSTKWRIDYNIILDFACFDCIMKYIAYDKNIYTFYINDVFKIVKIRERKLVDYQDNNDSYAIQIFHKIIHHESSILHNTSWFGTQTIKYPTDMWIYQEIINEIKPNIIIETGSYKGGSALFLAHMLDILDNDGVVISIDIEKRDKPHHERIRYVYGDSISDETISNLRNIIQLTPEPKIMVILDSDHTKNHVKKELNIYSKFVSENSYLIVEDTNINGHPVLKNFGPGPWEAVQEFILNNKEFIIDKSKEKFMLTANPSGFLKKV